MTATRKGLPARAVVTDAVEVFLVRASPVRLCSMHTLAHHEMSARYSSRFLPSPLWAAPGRHLDVDSTRGWFLASGCNMALGRRWGLQAFYRYSHVGAVSGRAFFHGTHHRSGAFPMRNNRLGTGLFYAF